MKARDRRRTWPRAPSQWWSKQWTKPAAGGFQYYLCTGMIDGDACQSSVSGVVLMISE